MDEDIIINSHPGSRGGRLGDKILPFCIEADGTFIPEHIGQGKKLPGAGQYLMGCVFALQFVVKIKLLELDVVPEVVAFYSFPGHHELL